MIDEEMQIKNQIEMKYLALLLFLFAIKEANAEHIPVDASMSSKPVFVHAVYFWLHESVTEAERAEFIKMLKGFKKIKSVSKIYVGSPAGTPRTIVDNTYDVALMVQFKDKAGHDYYQIDKIHTDAIKIFEGWIKDIKIYDMVTEKGTAMEYN